VKKILITGANGFLGSHLVKELVKLRDYTLICFVRKRKGKLEKIKKDIKIITGDIRSEKDVEGAVKGVDGVIHLAASVSSFDKKMNFDVNVLGAKNIVGACKKHGVKKVLFTSTSMALKKGKEQCNYGWTKLKAEEVFTNSNLDLTILRLTLVYGEGGKAFTKIVKNVQMIPFIIPLIGTGNYKKQPAYVGDVVNVIINCLENDITVNKTYCLAGPEELTFNEIVRMIARYLKIKKVVVPLPITFCKILAFLTERFFIVPPISRRDIISLNQNQLADISLVQKELNYRPRNFEEGLKKSL